MHVTEVLREVLPWLDKGAALTATVFDDAAVDVLRFALENETIAAWLDSLFHAEPENRMALALAASPEVQEAFAARKIDWQKFITETLPTILKIIAIFA